MWILVVLLVGIGIIAAVAELLSKDDCGDKSGDAADDCQTCGEVNCQLRQIKQKAAEKKKKEAEKAENTNETK